MMVEDIVIGSQYYMYDWFGLMAPVAITVTTKDCVSRQIQWECYPKTSGVGRAEWYAARHIIHKLTEEDRKIELLKSIK